MKRLPIIFLAAALSACSVSSDSVTASKVSDLASCRFITGGGSQVTSVVDSGCLDCSVANVSAAGDGDTSTNASVMVKKAAKTAGAAIRATAQPGIVFSAGSNAGAIVALPSTNGGVAGDVDLRTYLGGALQETHSLVKSGGNVCGLCGDGATPQLRRFQATKPFDAVEVFTSGTFATDTSGTQVYEFCSDSNSNPGS